ncbi:Foldase protein prsA precursor [Solibacillus isronensis B3W22]|uniref:peptidylprolyl isomerase n=2 Tax=Solibacillus TaxID=648800 RepID=F2F170_SOLSS|nr:MULTISPECIES: peptidyl-prolyl cis-trans isomerase [Solibacillus]AMO87516.1 foldase [Solibacillus silvestris]EKB43767.1 Foldase protein prsA precursor [Solibacillus isronensis B3W22]BAK14434.1 parvulin-like peptidyl-prolyl isomerase [Solibacillus silvestris StLB046]
MKSNRNLHKTPQPPQNNLPYTQRRLKTKPTLLLLLLLLIGNLFWFVLWLLPSDETTSEKEDGGEKIAAVEGDPITRQQWLAEMENRYGKETLQSLVNEAVMEKAAEKYKLDVKEEEIDLEIALLRSAQDSNDSTLHSLSPEQLRQKMRAQLILDKVLTNDIVVKENEAKKYYEDNKSIYNIPTTHRTSIIIVNSKEDAERVEKELKDGSDFAVLAREHSLDTASASLGGDIGFISSSQSAVDPAILPEVEKLKEKETSKPFVLSDGRYAIVKVTENMEGQSFSFDEVEGHVKRQLALEQLSPSITPEAFWAEFNATWIYGESKN